MRTPIRLGAFVLVLAVVFGAAAGLGRVTGGPAQPPPATHAEAGADGEPGGHDEGGAEQGGHDAGGAATGRPGAAGVPAGLQVVEDGYRLVPVSATLATGAPHPFRFRVLGPDGAPLTRYTPSHDKDLHLIVVRRDLSGFQHVHPTMASDGTWSVPLAVAAPGAYRVFADFQPAGRDDGLTLGLDVPAPGDYRPRPLPEPARSTTVAGYTVTLAGDLAPGGSSRLTFSVARDGRPVTGLEPYLGAYGHLVALREGDLAYLHVHPDGAPGDGRTAAGPAVTFHAEVPSAGTYRLYLDFRHAGRVHTAEFTAVAGTPVARPEAPDHTHG